MSGASNGNGFDCSRGLEVTEQPLARIHVVMIEFGMPREAAGAIAHHKLHHTNFLAIEVVSLADELAM